MTEYGSISTDTGVRISRNAVGLPAPQFSWQTAQRLGRIVSSSLDTQSNRHRWGYDLIEEYAKVHSAPKVKCHNLPLGRGHRYAAEIWDGERLFILCESAFHNILVAGHCVSDWKEWRADTQGKRKWNMKAPKPKMADFADVELVKELCGGLDKKVKATVVGVPRPGRYGWQVTFSTKKGDFVRSVKEESKAYKTLWNAFGDDFDKWDGQVINVYVHTIEDGEYKGQESIVFEGL